jgi:hypothetical protein
MYAKFLSALAEVGKDTIEKTRFNYESSINFSVGVE